MFKKRYFFFEVSVITWLRLYRSFLLFSTVCPPVFPPTPLWPVIIINYRSAAARRNFKVRIVNNISLIIVVRFTRRLIITSYFNSTHRSHDGYEKCQIILLHR